ncbi:hypothetical protein WH47_03937 [Habropoda laboriosa]|uniref:Uncharacterized protein n=1 Tax=Habropoda laboriosa TaxID=597456 RepID=A0A0L7QUE2_9HYME|nr:hypothetical protein WH47_03937 [Habropoda laboriosa]
MDSTESSFGNISETNDWLQLIFCIWSPPTLLPIPSKFRVDQRPGSFGATPNLSLF